MRVAYQAGLLPAAGLGLCANLFGAYVYDYAQSPVIQDNSRWSTNGSPSYGTWGVHFSSSGSLISIPAISGVNPNDYEVNATLAIKPGGGTSIYFFRTNSSSVVAGSGSYESIEIVVPPSFTTQGMATVNINQCVNGTVTNISSFSMAVWDGIDIRTVIAGNAVWMFSNNVYVSGAAVASMTGIRGSADTECRAAAGLRE